MVGGRASKFRFFLTRVRGVKKSQKLSYVINEQPLIMMGFDPSSFTTKQDQKFSAPPLVSVILLVNQSTLKMTISQPELGHPLSPEGHP